MQFFFQLLPNFSDFINSDDCVGKNLINADQNLFQKCGIQLELIIIEHIFKKYIYKKTRVTKNWKIRVCDFRKNIFFARITHKTFKKLQGSLKKHWKSCAWEILYKKNCKDYSQSIENLAHEKYCSVLGQLDPYAVLAQMLHSREVPKRLGVEGVGVATPL